MNQHGNTDLWNKPVGNTLVSFSCLPCYCTQTEYLQGKINTKISKLNHTCHISQWEIPSTALSWTLFITATDLTTAMFNQNNYCHSYLLAHSSGLATLMCDLGTDSGGVLRGEPSRHSHSVSPFVYSWPCHGAPGNQVQRESFPTIPFHLDYGVTFQRGQLLVRCSATATFQYNKLWKLLWNRAAHLHLSHQLSLDLCLLQQFAQW